MSKVKFIQLTAASSTDYQTKINKALGDHPGAIIFVANNGAGQQEIWANGLQYKVGGGVNVEGILDNVLVFGADNTISDSGIQKNTITEGYTKDKIGAVNASDINTLDKLRQKIAARNTTPGDTGAPKDYNFDTFIKDLFQNVNGEVNTTGIVNPTITITTDNQSASHTIEVGDTTQKTLSVTYTKGTFSQGSYYSHTVTNGYSADSFTSVNSGCTAGNWKIQSYDPSTKTYSDIANHSVNTAYTKTISTGHTYTISGSTELSIPTAKTVSTGRYGINQEYTGATGWESATTSYGNRLFISNPIPASSCQDGPTDDVSLTVSADFYHFVDGTSYLGPKDHVGEDAVVGNGSVIYIPNDWNWNLTWVVSGNTNYTNDSTQSEEIVYLELPSGGDITKFTSTIPKDKGYKTYKKITFNVNLPEFDAGKDPKLSITKN